MKIKNRNKSSNVPNLRFPEFEGEWKARELEEICELTSSKRIYLSEYVDNGIPFYRGKEISELKQNIQPKDVLYISSELYNEYKNKYGVPQINDILITAVGTLGNVLVIKNKDPFYFKDGNLIWLKDINVESDFLAYLLEVNKKGLELSAIGSSQKALTMVELKKLTFSFPSKEEQNKIATLLSLIDTRISTQSQIIEELKSLKKTLRSNLYQQIIETEKTNKIANLLNYEQPTNYIVTNTNYSNDCSLTPVLTANKAFILGYTNEKFGIYDKGECIIFDDFTMDLKYVDFPFKVKSSAIKILTAKLGVNLRFIYEYLSFLKLTSTDHKRHYISEIEPMCISLPKIEIQNNTANILSLLDKKIDLEIKQYDLLVNQKKYLLSQMFI